MFPLDFPLGVLKARAQKGDFVLDPFCGRGTTNFAARLSSLSSLGIDASPVAVAITASKLVTTTVADIMAEARHILDNSIPQQIPAGEFWQWAYHPLVLNKLCCFREAFSKGCSTPAQVALRGILLGALHGPKQKRFSSYFSNQCPRTYAPKPTYATRYWKERQLTPHEVDVLSVIERRAKRYFSNLPAIEGSVVLGDSRKWDVLFQATADTDARFRWVITSPPYYGMRTYIPDQWLRNWFLGGKDVVDYSYENQVVHSSPDDFARDLRLVWQNAAKVCSDNATMIIRFGGIADRKANPLDLIKHSLDNSGWSISSIYEAGTAKEGKRQADTFLRQKSKPMTEYDVWAVPQNSYAKSPII